MLQEPGAAPFEVASAPPRAVRVSRHSTWEFSRWRHLPTRRRNRDKASRLALQFFRVNLQSRGSWRVRPGWLLRSDARREKMAINEYGHFSELPVSRPDQSSGETRTGHAERLRLDPK